MGGAASATFVYDGDGNRVKATFGSVTTAYVGNHYEKEGSTVRMYYYAGGARVAMREGSTLYYILTDHLGSTAITANGDGTAEVGELRYYPYGGTRYTSGTTPTNRRFTGQVEDATIGLYFYNARCYDPALGRFVQADTIVPSPGNPQSLNRYSYVAGNPLKYTDPTGHRFKPPVRFPISIDISGWNPKVVQALDVVQETARSVAELPPIIAGPVAAARSFVKHVNVDSEAGTMVVGNRDPVSANELALELVGLSAVVAAPSAGLGEAVDDIARDVVDEPASLRLGGRYRDLDTQGGLYHRHHMPADSVNGLSKGQGPAILMDPTDHMDTASWGPAGEQYRALQRQLIEQGLFDDAIMMDIDDLLIKFGNKYVEHILQMIDSLE